MFNLAFLKNLKPLKSFLVFLFLLGGSVIFAQSETANVIDSLSQSQYLDSLRKEFGFMKIIPEGYELAFLTALSHYPELDSSQIRFKEARIKTTLNARPTIGSLLFRKREKRKYIIRINSQKKDSLILLSDAPFNSQIGLFGHELGHFADYHKRSFFGVLKRLISYSTLKGKSKFEKEIDTITIERGLGWQLYAWSYYVLFDSDGSKAYKEYKRSVYLTPKEIKQKIYE
ncbi:hypothetical protein N9089_01930 [Crocinitomicaceae bacterium]|nr:hypothetical protein [Crocinitomicaceae bacterium]